MSVEKRCVAIVQDFMYQFKLMILKSGDWKEEGMNNEKKKRKNRLIDIFSVNLIEFNHEMFHDFVD